MLTSLCRVTVNTLIMVGGRHEPVKGLMKLALDVVSAQN